VHEPPPGWDDGLDEAHVAAIRSFLDGEVGARDLMERVRADIGLQFALARADTRPHLILWFSEHGVSRSAGWVPDPVRSGPIGDGAVGTEWSWTGVHDRVPEATAPGSGPEPSFNSTAPSGREVVVRGFTLMSVDDDQLTVRRYVDWAGVFTQLGLTLNWRTPVLAGPPL
jgi:hypothetical protein